ncbi:MAG: hypothetical protein II649_05545, partial [Kiritimatiellae bacterium]|nr:hypothetical protein [Kiritimatiellia bacterium]
MRNNASSVVFTLLAAASASFGGLREDFARPDPGPGAGFTAQAVFEARCAKVLPGGLPAFKPYAGPDSIKGISLAGLSSVDARSLCVAQGEVGGMRVFGFRDVGRRFARELAIVPGAGLDAASAEVWDPAQGTIERPFTENGRILLSLAPEETLFLVWPGRRTAALPPRVDNPVGPETQLRVSLRETPPVDGGAALEGASWIWHPATRLAKGFATLRTSFDIPANAKVDGAKLTFSCDNGAVVKINGREVARQGNGSEAWRRLSVKDVRSALKPGRNTVEALCENTVDGDAGLLASIDIVAGGKPVRVFTDPKTWEASLDGKSFTAAWGENRYGSEPWLRFDEHGFAPQRPLAKKKSLEISFDLGTVKPGGRLFLVRDDPCSGTKGGTAAHPVSVSVNGTFAGGFVGRQRRLDVTRFVRAGANAIRVESTFFQNPRLVWTAPATGPYGLACEYQREPLGVVKPRFFWKYAGGKPDRFTFEVRDCAGKIVAAQATDKHLYFEPQMALEPFTRYRWRVEGGGGADEG